MSASTAIAGRKTNALQSLFGAKTALSGNVGGQVRAQEVLTNTWIIDAARESLGDIDLDPCASSSPANWFARENFTLPSAAVEIEAQLAEEKARGRKARKLVLSELNAKLKPFYLGGALVQSWGSYRNRAYVNPPFGFLEHWLARCATEAHAFRRIVGLWPVRTHRPWWVAKHIGAEIVLLSYDVKFVGHNMAFPAPLALVSWGCRIPPLGERETARWRP